MKHDAGEALPPVVVSRETTERLNVFLDVLRRWSGTLNLVSRGDLPFLWDRHVADSLQVLPLVPPAGELADLGSGGGFPGLVLAIASGRPFHLVEADQRKAAFLREAARAAAAVVQVHAARVEQVRLPKLRLVTARALAPLPKLLALAAPLLGDGGMCVFLKGRTVDAELTQAMGEWHMQLRRWASQTGPDAAILQISELSRDAGCER